MITPSFNLTATERVLPKLALDFTTESLDSRVTFTRTTGSSNPATYVNSIGVLTAATNNEPRFDYDPITLVCRGLLIEESRANLLTQSEEFSSSADVTVDANTATAPDGALTGDKAIPTATTSQKTLIKTAPVTSGTTYTLSIFAKAAELSYIQLTLTAAGISTRANFDVATGVLGTVDSGVAASITPFDSGWYRCAATFTAGSTGTANCSLGIVGSATAARLANYTGNGVDGLYFWGAQLEAGAFPTSYIPTEATAVTRNADVATMTGTNFSDWFNPTEGTFEIQSQLYSASGTRGYLSANDGTSNNVIQMYSTGTSGNYEVVTGGVTQATQGQSSTINTGLLSRCVAYKLNNCGQAINGSFYGVDTSCTIPTVDRLQIGGINAGTSARFNGLITKISYWPQRLLSAEIAAFSKG
jgi:hypothetical protein